MSGHSKWSKVKHQKATTDVVKASEFTKASRAITLAVRQGGGVTDPAMNFRLRLAVEKAREVNMPKENIQRAVEKAKQAGSESIEEVLYEAYGHGGCAIIIQAATDNRQRAVAAIKNILHHSGGTLAAQGAVMYLFKQAGVLLVARSDLSFDTVLDAVIGAGGDDVVATDDFYEVYTSVELLADVWDGLEKEHITIVESHVVLRPILPVKLSESDERTLAGLTAEIEQLEDVQRVYTNSA